MPVALLALTFGCVALAFTIFVLCCAAHICMSSKVAREAHARRVLAAKEMTSTGKRSDGASLAFAGRPFPGRLPFTNADA